MNNESNYGVYLILALLIASIFTRSDYVPLPAAYLLTSTAYGAVILYVYKKGNLRITGGKYVLSLIAMIYTIHISHIFLNAIMGGQILPPVVRTITYVIFTTTGLFIIPYVVEHKEFLGVVSRLSAVIVVIGLPTAVIGSYSILGIEILPYQYDFNLPLILISNDSISPVQSIIDNPNVFGFFAGLGFASSLAELHLVKKRVVPIVLLSVNFIGSYLSGSRAAALTLVVATGIYVFYRWKGEETVVVTSVLLITASFIFLAIRFGFIPGPEVIQSVNLRNRGYLWRSSAQAVKSNPFGFGAGDQARFIRRFLPEDAKTQPPHSSYVRMFLTTGFVGGIAYLLLTIHVIISSAKNVDSSYSMAVVVAVIMISIHQIFVGFSLFGIAFNSIISSIFFGYGIRTFLDR